MLKANRIRMQVTVANSRQTNGLAERMKQMVVGKIRNAILYLGFPSTLWAEIASCIVYTNNRLPVFSNDNRIPNPYSFRSNSFSFLIGSNRYFGDRYAASE
jgi:hypothetical protein